MTVNELIKKLKCIKEIGKGEHVVRVHTDIDGCLGPDVVNDVGDYFSIDDMYCVVTIESKEEE